MSDRDRAAEREGTEREIDALYQRPLAEFTAARNELAKGLTKAGARDDASRVKALQKPTVTPWAINQVYWQARSIWDRLMEAGAALREAQVAAIERPGTTDAQVQRGRERLRAAAEAHRDAIADAVHQATRAATQAGVHPAADQLTRMLESVSLAPEPPARPGRFTDVVAPAGFGALFGAALGNGLASSGASPRDDTASAPASGTSARPGARTAAGTGSRTADREAAREAEKEAAREAARQQAARLKAAADALTAARHDERQARATASAARTALEDAELALTQARRALADAERGAARASERRESAEAALDALKGTGRPRSTGSRAES